MSSLFSSPLDRVDLLAPCDYEAQKEICILYIEVSFFIPKKATPY